MVTHDLGDQSALYLWKVNTSLRDSVIIVQVFTNALGCALLTSCYSLMVAAAAIVVGVALVTAIHGKFSSLAWLDQSVADERDRKTWVAENRLVSIV